MKWKVIGPLALAVTLVAQTALAGFDVELPAESAYAYTGGCTANGTGMNGRTVPRCDATTDGSFTLRAFTRVLSGAAVFTVQEIRFITGSGVDATSDARFNVDCSALVMGTTTVSFATAGTAPAAGNATVTQDLDTTTPAGVCDTTGDYCKTTVASSSTAIWNTKATAAACASTDCNNTDLICRITYDADGTNVDAAVDVLSVKLTVGP